MKAFVDVFSALDDEVALAIVGQSLVFQHEGIPEGGARGKGCFQRRCVCKIRQGNADGRQMLLLSELVLQRLRAYIGYEQTLQV